MGALSIDDIKPGMVLASDLRSPQGRLVLGKGAVISAEHINICKVWGVLEADIEGHDAKGDASVVFSEQSEVIRTASIQLTKHRFRFSGVEHPPLKEMARLHTFRTAESLSDATAGKLLGELASEAGKAGEQHAFRLPQLKLEKVLGKDLELSSLPDIFNHIIEALNNPRSSAAYVADVISSDPNLSAKLLKLVNSPFYGLSQSVDKLSRAVAILGSNKLTDLALGVSVISVFKDIPPGVLSMKSFWRHSVTCGILSKLIAGHSPLDIDEERVFVAGLLHDSGRLVMVKHHPEYFLAAMESMTTHGDMTLMEQGIWGFDHAAIADRLLETWQFPPLLARAVSQHHTPDSVDAPVEAAVVHVADVMTHALTLAGPGGRPVPPMSRNAWDTLKLAKSAIRPIATMLDTMVDETVKVFFDE